jgi:hypothetical protein
MRSISVRPSARTAAANAPGSILRLSTELGSRHSSACRIGWDWIGYSRTRAIPHVDVSASGCCTGIRNVMRTAREIERAGGKAAPTTTEE